MYFHSTQWVLTHSNSAHSYFAYLIDSQSNSTQVSAYISYTKYFVSVLVVLLHMMFSKQCPAACVCVTGQCVCVCLCLFVVGCRLEVSKRFACALRMKPRKVIAQVLVCVCVARMLVRICVRSRAFDCAHAILHTCTTHGI